MIYTPLPETDTLEKLQQLVDQGVASKQRLSVVK
jgi:hypothetical protein